MTKPKAKLDTFIGIGLDKEELERGKLRYSEYRKNYPQLNKLSNAQLLEELVWLECLQDRYKSQVGLVTQPKKGPDGTIQTSAVPKNLQDAIANGLGQIIELKTKLGLFEDQKALDAFKELETLKLKAAEYRKTHSLSFKTTCPFCAKIYFLKRKTEGFEEFISPFYADDKVVKNDELHACWKEGILPKERYAKAMGVSEFYIDWLEENIYKNHKKDK